LLSGVSVAATASPLTASGSVLGTLHYMAPEQLEGKDTDECVDVFAFGAVLYEMVTGRRAFEGQTPASVIAAVLEHPAAPMAARVPDVPRALDELLADCLAKDPNERWRTCTM
jgi:serine/threonine-protein kinase